MSVSVYENVRELPSSRIRYTMLDKDHGPLVRIERVDRAPEAEWKAEFRMELDGVNIGTGRGAWQEAGALEALRGNLVYSALRQGGRMRFVYKGASAQGHARRFGQELVCEATGRCGAETLEKLKRIWSNLSVLLGVSARERFFSPVNRKDLLRPASPAANNFSYCRAGVLIGFCEDRSAGFIEGRSGKRQDMIISPCLSKSEKSNGHDRADIELLSRALLDCRHQVQVELCLEPFELKNTDLAALEDVLLRMEKNGRMQVNWAGRRIDSIDPSLWDGIIESLKTWTRTPFGVKARLDVVSEHEISESLVFIAARSLLSTESIRSVENEEEVLNLADAVNGVQYLPCLFPSADFLEELGHPRRYSSAISRLPAKGIVLGFADNNIRQKVRITRQDRQRHTYIVGATGTGKSTLIYNMVMQDIMNGEGVGVIDPHGELFKDILETVPENRINDLVIVNPSDPRHSTGINFLEIHPGSRQAIEKNFVVNEMISIFDRLYDLRMTGGPVFEQYMRNALFLLLENRLIVPTLIDVVSVFENSSFLNFLLNNCGNKVIESFWRGQALKGTRDVDIRNIAPYICSKLNQFVANSIMRPIVGQKKSTINFREIMDSRKILLVNLEKGVLGDLDTRLLGMLITGKIFKAAMSRNELSRDKRASFYLYIDEFQNFTTNTLNALLSESRKYGICLTMANQNTSQLINQSYGNQNVMESVLGNVANMLMLRTGVMDAEKLEPYASPFYGKTDLQQLPDYHVLARILANNKPLRPFVLRTMLMNAPKLDSDKIEAIISKSNSKYARSTKEVEEEISLALKLRNARYCRDEFDPENVFDED